MLKNWVKMKNLMRKMLKMLKKKVNGTNRKKKNLMLRKLKKVKFQ